MRQRWLDDALRAAALPVGFEAAGVRRVGQIPDEARAAVEQYADDHPDFAYAG